MLPNSIFSSNEHGFHQKHGQGSVSVIIVYYQFYVKKILKAESASVYYSAYGLLFNILSWVTF